MINVSKNNKKPICFRFFHFSVLLPMYFYFIHSSDSFYSGWHFVLPIETKMSGLGFQSTYVLVFFAYGQTKRDNLSETHRTRLLLRQTLVFCYQNCSDLLWEKWRPRIFKNFEITRTIYSNSERSEQFLVAECFFNFLLDVSHV